MATSHKKKLLHNVQLEESIQEVWQRQADMQHTMSHTSRSPAQVPAAPQRPNRAEVPYLDRLAGQIKKKIKNKKSRKSRPQANVARPNTDGKQSRKASLWCWGK
ncbi:uncharacterized protein ACA1_135920 [Acanthamoeba castellanii str. Neff]|jgi:hypothetical protein|uniref:Uncharacterized protein n=1 Tax=Acanthamoeba castellanii (strain ATCC 30010 / Neff) TaxID=1257118 RepID=L8GEE0_ACACF|nr:uncharacterized protein ACA1_135920 [Acanthamoeba castellanii str. Neff]ELR11392.1 hypothetical protein ACA1_135920 [Acanthamoeba castellanii str. Neff]